MSGHFDQIDYSALPTPDAIEAWAFEAIFSAMREDFLARWNAARAIDPTLPAYDVSSLETDPGMIILQAGGYRESEIRQRINDAIRATYLSSAQKNDLTDRAAEYLTNRAPGEIDASLRKRAQLAWENLSIGGSYGGYAYQALAVAPLDIADVAVYGYELSSAELFGTHAIPDFPKGEVRIALLGASASGAVPASIIKAVQTTLSDRSRRKVNDRINVVQATRLPYEVKATLILRRGASPDTIVEAARQRAKDYAALTRRLGIEATRGGFLASLMNAEPGIVVDVELQEPTAAVGGGPLEAPVLTGIDLAWVYL